MRLLLTQHFFTMVGQVRVQIFIFVSLCGQNFKMRRLTLFEIFIKFEELNNFNFENPPKQ